MKIYKGYELMQAVNEGKLSLQQRVNSIAQYYNNCTIEFVLKDNAINIMDLDFEVIEENKGIEEKLDWEEIIGGVGKPVWDNKRKKWRVLDYYCREKDIFYVSFSDTSNREKFEEKELYFKESEEK